MSKGRTIDGAYGEPADPKAIYVHYVEEKRDKEIWRAGFILMAAAFLWCAVYTVNVVQELRTANVQLQVARQGFVDLLAKEQYESEQLQGFVDVGKDDNFDNYMQEYAEELKERRNEGGKQ